MQGVIVLKDIPNELYNLEIKESMNFRANMFEIDMRYNKNNDISNYEFTLYKSHWTFF